jgi:hypothetical protein
MSTPSSPSSQAPLRLAAGLVALAAGIGAAVAVALLAHSILKTAVASSSPSGAVTAPASSGSSGATTSFPSPPAGALVLGREDRDLAVGLAATPEGPGRLGLQASVIGQEGPAAGLTVGFRVRSTGSDASVPAAACGAGCYGTTLAVDGRPRSVRVSLQGKDRPSSAVTFALPKAWPPKPADRLVQRADSTWRALSSVVLHERLSNGVGSTVNTLWQFAAPDRLAYHIVGGPSAVVIGGKRWDREPGGRWQASAQTPLTQPVPTWEGIADAHVLGTGTVRGRPVWLVSFFDPQIHAWFELAVDRQTLHTLRLQMTAQAHFMQQRFGPFDRPLAIVPPAGAAS